MNELELLFDNTAFVVNFIIQIILLIVFLRLALNVGKIRKHITASSASDLHTKAEKAIFKGDAKTAIDAYLDTMFIIASGKEKWDIEEDKKQIKLLKQKIEDLGGVVPEKAMELIKKNVGDVE